MSAKDIRLLTLMYMIEATVTDNVHKFRKYCEIKVEVEEINGENKTIVTRDAQPKDVFHR